MWINISDLAVSERWWMAMNNVLFVDQINQGPGFNLIPFPSLREKPDRVKCTMKPNAQPSEREECAACLPACLPASFFVPLAFSSIPAVSVSRHNKFGKQLFLLMIHISCASQHVPSWDVRPRVNSICITASLPYLSHRMYHWELLRITMNYYVLLLQGACCILALYISLVHGLSLNYHMIFKITNRNVNTHTHTHTHTHTQCRTWSDLQLTALEDTFLSIMHGSLIF